MDADLDRLGGRQQGLLTTWQLLAAGWTRPRIARAVAGGVLIPIRRGVYRVRGAPVTRQQAWMAAVLSAGCDAVLGNLTAAQAWGFPYIRSDEAIHVLTTARAQPRQPGVRGHRTLWLPAHDRTRLQFVAITTVERTYLDVCGALPYKQLELAGEELIRRRRLVLPKLVRCYEQAPVSGRRKSAPMKRFLASHLEDFDPGGSDEELDLMRVLTRVAFRPLPRQQFRVLVEGHQYRLDYAWPEVMHAMEYYGAKVHGQPGAVHYDSERTRRLKRAGWALWPVTSRTTANEIVAIARFAFGL